MFKLIKNINITNFDFKQNPIVRFTILSIIALILWVIFDSFYSADIAIMKSIQVQTTWLLNAFTNQEYISSEVTFDNGTSKFGMFCSNSGMRVGKTCNGKSIMFMYASFIVIFPNINIKRRLLYLFLGLILLHEFNVIRVMLLAIILENAPDYFPTMHHYFFQILVYIIIFFLVKKFIYVNKNTQTR